VLGAQELKQVLKNTFVNTSAIAIIFLSLILFLESLWVINQKCHARILNIQYYQLLAQQDFLNSEWSQLLIEQGAFGSSAHIEQAAQDYLNMDAPKPQDMRIVKQGD
jgi:cell division protein FtsL